jgi:histidyl-tRNA synthetase
VRGMGYYTGTIFEIAHPASGSSVGGGGRYDGMIGRFLGTDVPACGFSIGFERVVDLAELPEEREADSVALVHDGTVPAAVLLALKEQLLAEGRRVRLERRTKNMKLLLDGLATAGFASFAYVEPGVTDASALALRPLG